jgi:hypothetical protein
MGKNATLRSRSNGMIVAASAIVVAHSLAVSGTVRNTYAHTRSRALTQRSQTNFAADDREHDLHDENRYLNDQKAAIVEQIALRDTQNYTHAIVNTKHNTRHHQVEIRCAHVERVECREENKQTVRDGGSRDVTARTQSAYQKNAVRKTASSASGKTRSITRQQTRQRACHTRAIEQSHCGPLQECNAHSCTQMITTSQRHRQEIITTPRLTGNVETAKHDRRPHLTRHDRGVARNRR